MSVVPTLETLWAMPSLVTVYSTTAGQTAPGGASAKPADGGGVGEGVGADETANDGAIDGETVTAGGVHAAPKTIAAMSVARTRPVSPRRLDFLPWMDRVYLDHAATTAVDPKLIEELGLRVVAWPENKV